MSPVLETSPWDHVARQKLSHIFGPDRAEEILAGALREMGVNQLRTASDLVRLGEVLCAQGGFMAAVGTALITHARLRGAA